MEEVGVVTHYFNKIGVAVIKVTGNIKVGDTVHFKGANVDFSQKVESMQIEHENIEEAKPGDDIGMKVEQKVHENVRVYKE
ncbi:hypothetical protein DRN74_03185 [Candidatus Micrarchaeota archaeon]|nr:MAG: hypothetical protein DRN74_03185 [Candidatus Micrarchaeota archaeon]